MSVQQRRMRLGFQGLVALPLCLLVLAACTRPPLPAPPITGGDRDAHGCIGSAGYSWCARSAQCERPWERAEAQQFELSQSAFDRSCDNATAPG